MKRTRRNRALVVEMLDSARTYDVEISKGTSIVDSLQMILDRAMDHWRMACKEVDKLDEEDFWFAYIDAQGNTLYEPNVWIKYEQALRAEILDMSIRMGHLGVDERRVRVAEAQVELMGRALLAAAQKIGLDSPIQKALGQALREELEVLEGEAVDMPAPPRKRRNDRSPQIESA